MSVSWQRDAEGEGPDTYAAVEAAMRREVCTCSAGRADWPPEQGPHAAWCTLGAEHPRGEAAAGPGAETSTEPVLPHIPSNQRPATGLCGVRSPGGGLLCEREPHPGPAGHLWRHVVPAHRYDVGVWRP